MIFHTDLPPSSIAKNKDVRPNAISVEQWDALFTLYVGDSLGEMRALRLSEWQNFGRFLNGSITSGEYYTDPSLRADIERAADEFADRKFNAYWEDLNYALHMQVVSVQNGRHWKEAATNASVRMYLDVAQLVTKNLGLRLIKEDKIRFPKERAVVDPLIDSVVAAAVDEAFLSPEMGRESSSGFIMNVVKRRLIDFHRLHLGRSEKIRERRPRFLRIDGEEGSEFIHDVVGAVPQRIGKHEIMAQDILTEIDRSLSRLTERERQVFQAYLQAKQKDSETPTAEIARQIGMDGQLFDCHLSHARRNLIAVNPLLANQVTRLFGEKTHLVSRLEGENERKVLRDTETKLRVREDHFVKSVEEQEAGIRKRKFIVLGNHLLTLRQELYKLFDSQIPNKTGVSRPILLTLLKPGFRTMPNLKDHSLSDATHDVLVAHLQETGQASKIEMFELIFAEMREDAERISGYKPQTQPLR